MCNSSERECIEEYSRLVLLNFCLLYFSKKLLKVFKYFITTFSYFRNSFSMGTTRMIQVRAVTMIVTKISMKIMLRMDLNHSTS